MPLHVLMTNIVLCARSTGESVRYGVFPFGPFQTLELTPEEVAAKREVLAEASRRDSFVASVAPLFGRADVETYRLVPRQRD